MQEKQRVNRRQFLRMSSAVGATAFLAACAAPAAPAADSGGEGEAMAEMISLRYQSPGFESYFARISTTSGDFTMCVLTSPHITGQVSLWAVVADIIWNCTVDDCSYIVFFSDRT